jgi:hypothetical protein
MKKALLPLAALGIFAAARTPVFAEQRVIATGLLNPAKIVLGPAGTLLVTEFDAKPSSGRISIIGPGGARRTLIDGLPSGVSPEDPDGPTGLYLDENNTLYVAIGEGDQLQPGTAMGTSVPNQAGPASPLLATILQINFSASVDKIAAGFTLKTTDHPAIADGNSATLDNGAGDKATIGMLSEFRYRPDPVAIYRNSHPYGLTKLPGDTGHLYLTDAGLNALVQVDLPSGRSRKLTAFPNQPNHGPIGGPVAEAVPDSVRPFGGQLLVTLLTGFPFATGNSKIMLVDPASGGASVFLDNLTSTIDVAYRARFLGGLELYVLQFSADLLNNGPGRLSLFRGGASTVLADNLPGPSSMILDSTSSSLYVTTKAGTVMQIDLAP